MSRVPLSGKIVSPRTPSRVDFPQPDGPMTATDSPSSTDSDAERSACTVFLPRW
jgi:hypothetical protein